MTARILVVDDIAANVKLLEAKLAAEYFDVVTASNGEEALKLATQHTPDLVLLDVMMPVMDGFEVCRRFKADPRTAHVPVVIVTALDQPGDRVAGLEAGADDFLTKPVNDIALFARVRSLIRLKMMTDELRMREATGASMGINDPAEAFAASEAPETGRILVVEDKEVIAERIRNALSAGNEVTVERSAPEALVRAKGGDFDLFIVSMSLQSVDGLRFCSQLRSLETTRHVPVLVLVDEDDTKRLVRALEMGVNDYLMRPIDINELIARTRSQLKRKRYSDKLRQNFQLSLEMAITDQLTGLYNRRYMASHLSTLLDSAGKNGKPLSFLIMDIDFFKAINDAHGHDIGDEILKGFARRVEANVRGIDLACRYGGEEFVVVMPETDISFAYAVAERLRQQVADAPFDISRPPGKLKLTVSIGVTTSEGPADTAEALLRRADQALYKAKNGGRNRVVSDAA